MKGHLILALILMVPASVWSEGTVQLANDEWPPFILEGAEQGKAEKLVCEALRRSGRACEVAVYEWESVLEDVRGGEIDGIAAAWRNADRESYLLFSEPYLTNRIVPVVPVGSAVVIESAGDLANRRVALVTDYAYGEELDAKRLGFEAIRVASSKEALNRVRRGQADVALVDELVARAALKDPAFEDLQALNSVLAFRSLHFAMARQNPDAQAILADFNRVYELMLLDGTVNEILEVDWLATDFGEPGTVSVVMRSGVSLDELSNPTEQGAMYALDDSEYQWMRERNRNSTDVNYRVEGKSYSSLQSALNNVFGEDMVCEHQEYSSTFDCSKLFN
jgi:polar amino acid transport system substrate-binding protein